jgi:hypothetical protein
MRHGYPGAMLRRASTLAVAVLAAAALVAVARADGDPASDVLLTQDTYTPYPAPPKDVTEELARSVEAAYKKGFRVKVAVIATATDLGSVPEMLGRPRVYAKFLGSELSLFYKGPLLIVMAKGYGIYDAGRSTAAEEKVLASLPAPKPSAEELTAAAAEAVRKLTAAGALRSRDILKPSVFARPASAKENETVDLTYAVLEDSERAKEVVGIYAGEKRLARYRFPMRRAIYAVPHVVKWKAPSPLPKRLRYCVRATDAAGNRSTVVCAPITPAP